MSAKQTRGMGWRILDEDWLQLVLPNGIHIRARAVLTHFAAVEDQHEMRTKVLIEATAPKKLRGEPGDGRFRKEDVVESFEKFETQGTGESVYRLDDGSHLILRYLPRRVNLTNRFNNHGEPVLGVEANTETLILARQAPPED